MADKQRLSVIAQYDELVRNRAVLTSGIEAEFLTFVLNQEACRKRWHEVEASYAEARNRMKEMEQDILALQTKLKHARSQIDHEITKRQHAEQERDAYEKQILLVRELLNDKSNATMLNEKDRERLAFLSTDFHNTMYDNSPRRNMPIIEESGSLLSPSDISYDKTEEDLDASGGRGRRYKRPSAPPMDSDDITPPGKKRKSMKIRHRRSKSADLVTMELAGNAVGRTPIHGSTTRLETPASVRQRRKSSPANRTMLRSNSQGIGSDDEREGQPIGYSARKRVVDTPGNSSPNAWSPEMKRCNSGSSLTRPHAFISKTSYKQEPCFACGKKLKFGKSSMKCKDCRAVCHPECRDVAPLPCVPSVVTPSAVKNGQGYLCDYTPNDPPLIPAIVIHCVNEVEARGLSEVGIYRISGSDKDVKELKEKFLRGKGTPNLCLVDDIHVVCGCLKDFLRSLKEPLITYQLWNTFVKAAEKQDKQESLSDMYQAISQLPQPNRDTIAFLILHLQRVSECPECKMPASNLAKVFAPTMIGYSGSEPDAMKMIQETGKQQMVMDRLISISTDYWMMFINLDSRSSIQPNGQNYRLLPKYDHSSSNQGYSATPNMLGPMNVDNGLNDQSPSPWFTPKFGSHSSQSSKKPTQFFSSPSLK